MAHVEKRGPNRWRTRYRGPDGRERSRTFERKTDADRYAAEVESAKNRGEWVDPRRGQVRFEEWAAEVEASRVDRRASTRARDESLMRSMVLPTFGRAPLLGIDPVHVRQWVAAKVAAGYAPATVREAHRLLAGALDQAVTSGLIARTPCRGIDLPRIEDREMRFLSPPELLELAGALPDRHRALVVTAAYTGARFGELAALRLPRIDLLRRTLRIEETLNEVRGRIIVGAPKTRAGRRTVSIPGFLAEVLGEHLATFPPSEERIFSAPEGGPLRRNLFRRRTWLPAVRASVGEPCRFHDLRHSHAALLIAEGVHPKVLQERLGHASIATTLDVYGHLFDGLDQAAADALDAAYRGALAASVRPGGGLAAVAALPREA